MAYEDEQPRGVRYAQGPNPMRYSQSPAPGFAPPTVETRIPRLPASPRAAAPVETFDMGSPESAPTQPATPQATVPSAPSSLRDTALSPTGGFMPGTRAVMRGAGEDISRAVNKGDYMGAAGATVRGALALPLGIIEDTIEPPLRMVDSKDGPVSTGIRRFTSAALGREGAEPLVTIGSNPQVAGAPRDIRTDVQRQGADLTPVAAPRQTSFGNVTGDTAFENRGQVSAQNMALADNVAARSVPRTAFAPTENNLPAGYGVTIPESQAMNELAVRNAGVRSNFADAGLSARQARQFGAQDRSNDIQERAVMTRDATERRGQDITDKGFQRKDNVTMRGQDLEYGAKVAGTAATMAKAKQDQANSDRTFELEKVRVGADLAEKNRAARSASAESFRKDMETRFVGPDNKPDTAKVAAFSTALSSTMPRMIEDLEKKGTPEAKAKATEIRKRGVAALEPGDIDGMQQLFDRRERMRASQDMWPNSASFKESDNLFDYRQSGVDKTTFGGNRVVTPAGSVSVNDLRYADGPANAFLPDIFKTDSLNLTRGLRTE